MASDKHFHLFEFHLHGVDAQFGPRSIGDPESASSEPTTRESTEGTEIESGATDESGGRGAARSGLLALLAVGVLAAVAVALRRLAGASTRLDDLDDVEDLEEIVA